MLTWPSDLFPSAGGYAPNARALSGGQSLSGFEQVQSSLNDRWQAAFSFSLRRPANILALRALLTSLRGRVGTVGVPAFDNGRAPFATTPGSPIGSAVVDPPFSRLVTTIGGPIGQVIINPPFSRQWPALAGTPYEFSPLSGLAGSATMTGYNDFSFSGAAPEVGHFVELGGVRRRIVNVSGSGPFAISFDPAWQTSEPATTSQPLAITGTATIVSAISFNFAATSGAPAVGDSVVLSGAARKIVKVSGTRYAFEPAIQIGAATFGAVTATVNAAAALNATSVDLHFAAGGPPLPGHLFGVGARLYSINTVSSLGAGVYRLNIWPWLRVAFGGGEGATFCVPGNCFAPVCEMRLASDQEGAEALMALDLLRFGTVTVRFDEASA